MTNSARFIEAHKTAKQIRDCFSAYREAFTFALMEIYAMERQEKTTAEKLEALGISAWERGETKRYYINDYQLEALGISAWERGETKRYYINDYQLEAIFGLSIDRYNSGNISCALLNGEGISNSKAYKLLGRGIWYDANTDSWMQKTEFGTRELNATPANSLRI